MRGRLPGGTRRGVGVATEEGAAVLGAGLERGHAAELLRVLAHRHGDGSFAVLGRDVCALARFVSLGLVLCLLLLPFEVLLYQFILLQLVFLLFLGEVGEHTRQVEVWDQRRGPATRGRARATASRLALATFQVIIQIIYFLEYLVVTGKILLLHEAIRALA